MEVPRRLQLYRCKRCKRPFVVFELKEEELPAVLACPWCNPPVPGLARQENVVRKLGATMAEKFWNFLWKDSPPSKES